ncbi:discoidin domain-containing protein [Paenibacillus sp. Sa2BVA9]|uniref:Discoidin domain-containing protein n=1 Tax=Paenibacillus gallinarum TaxID=2762232 RepID=A0ABR8T0A1_9BACL|nr:discoidin domain-containing protein [Paenibacillus gallinarum]
MPKRYRYQFNLLSDNANDGNPSTRWAASSGALSQWWQVDLGQVK